MSTDAEAERFARYLVGAPADERIRALYARMIARGARTPGRADVALLRFAVRRPRGLGLLDAGLALVDPEAELRRRLYIMFAILEATPENHDRFLPVERGPLYIVAVAAAGLQGLLKGVVGALVVAIVKATSR